MRDLEPIRAVFRQACLYNHAADDLLCERLAEAMAPKPAAGGGDLSAAIAAAREALAKYQDREVRHYLDEAMEGLLAALDAAHPVGFEEWLAREMPAGTIIGDPKWWANLIARRSAQFAPQAPPAAVPAEVQQVIDEMLAIAPTCDNDWNQQLGEWVVMLAAAAKGEK